VPPSGGPLVLASGQVKRRPARSAKLLERAVVGAGSMPIRRLRERRDISAARQDRDCAEAAWRLQDVAERSLAALLTDEGPPRGPGGFEPGPGPFTPQGRGFRKPGIRAIVPLSASKFLDPHCKPGARSRRGITIPIYRTLQNSPLGSTIAWLSQANEQALRTIGLKDRDDPSH
jgi:hypothetical protein